MSGPSALTAHGRATLLAIAPRIVPSSAAMSPAAREAMVALIEETLASRAPGMRRQLDAFLAVMRWASCLRYLRPLDRLDGTRQDTILRWFESHPVPLIRSGFWGVRTLVLLGWYGQPDSYPSIAYAPSLDGNAVLHDRAAR